MVVERFLQPQASFYRNSTALDVKLNQRCEQDNALRGKTAWPIGLRGRSSATRTRRSALMRSPASPLAGVIEVIDAAAPFGRHDPLKVRIPALHHPPVEHILHANGLKLLAFQRSIERLSICRPDRAAVAILEYHRRPLRICLSAGDGQHIVVDP